MHLYIMAEEFTMFIWRDYDEKDIKKSIGIAFCCDYDDCNANYKYGK